MSVKVECRVCGDVYESDEVARVIAWSKSHDDSCSTPSLVEENQTNE